MTHQSNIITQTRRWGPRWRSMWRPCCDAWAWDLTPDGLIRTLARMCRGTGVDLAAEMEAGWARADAVDAERRGLR